MIEDFLELPSSALYFFKNWQIRLLDPCDRMLDLGTILIGKTLSRTVSLLNEGPASIQLKVNLQHDEFKEFLEINPDFVPTFKSKEIVKLNLKFHAIHRVESLELNLILQSNLEQIPPLLTIRAKCLAPSFKLSRDHIVIDLVYEGFCLEEKFDLINDGDLESKLENNSFCKIFTY